MSEEIEKLVKEQATKIADMLQGIRGITHTAPSIILESKELRLAQYLINSIVEEEWMRLI